MFPVFLVAPVFLTLSLLDAAMFFIMVRLLRRAWPAGPLLFLDRIGSAGVDCIAGLVAHHARRWWNWSLSPAGEEAAALAVLVAMRLLLGALFIT